MKLILLSDPHLTSKQPRSRLDNVLSTSLKKIEYVFRYANRIKAHILCSGDLSNTSRDILLLFKLISIITKYSNVKLLNIWGQHEQSNRNKNVPTLLGILLRAKLITILNNKNQYKIDNTNIYGCGWKEKIPKVISTKNNVLVIHAPIAIKPLWQGHQYYSAERFLEKNDEFDLILCGDIHRSFLISKEDRIICNTGPMMRLDATKYNLTHKPKFYIYDTETKKIQIKIIPHEESNVVLNTNHLEFNNKEEESLGNIFVNTKQVEDLNIWKIIETLISNSGREDSIRDVINMIEDKCQNES